MARLSIVIFALLTASAVQALPLKLANVAFPDINCKFDADCTIYVTDLAEHFVIGPAAGDAFLQSRSWPVGEAGTAGAGLYPYLYRIDMRELAGVTALPCIREMKINFGAISQLDYDGDMILDDVFIGTGGGLGSVAPFSAEQTGDSISFIFSPGVCAGSSPGTGESSFFFGLASAKAPVSTTATLEDALGHDVTLQARAPNILARARLDREFWQRWPYWLGVLSLVVLGYLLGRRHRRYKAVD